MIETEVRAPVETVTPIRPSEAIRLGCLIKPVQAFGRLGIDDTACVMGAMIVGFGNDVDSMVAFTRRMDQLRCPGCGFDGAEGKLTVPAHLNDDHRWSRERIADWLAEQGL